MTGKLLDEYLARAPWFLPSLDKNVGEPYTWYENPEAYYTETILDATGSYDNPEEQEPVERAFLDLVWEGEGYYLDDWDEDCWLSILDRATRDGATLHS